MIRHIILAAFIPANISCHAQNKEQMNNKNNPLLCNPQTGICEIPGTGIAQYQDSVYVAAKPVRIVYFTDPICSSCWGIEPQLRKLKLEYGNVTDIEYHMGGLLPDWSYNSGGISKPSDVAHHWDEVSIYYDIPIDGDLWLEDPLPSSYPPSIAFKAAEIQDKKKALLFLRQLREMVFLQKKNIAKWEHIAIAAEASGLDTMRLKADFEGNAIMLFEQDLKMSKEWGVKGFPSIFFLDSAGNREFVYGTKPYEAYEAAIEKLYPAAAKIPYNMDWSALFFKYPSLTAKEFSTLSGMSRNDSEQFLKQLTDKGKLKQFTTKNGGIWKISDVSH